MSQLPFSLRAYTNSLPSGAMAGKSSAPGKPVNCEVAAWLQDRLAPALFAARRHTPAAAIAITTASASHTFFFPLTGDAADWPSLSTEPLVSACADEESSLRCSRFSSEPKSPAV